MNTEYFDVTGMTCSACSARVEKSVSAVKGEALDKSALKKAVEEADYTVTGIE